MNWRAFFGMKPNQVGLLCNHDPNSETTTLSPLKMQTMEYPAPYRAVCKNCGRSFEFVKDEEGKFIKIKSKKIK